MARRPDRERRDWSALEDMVAMILVDRVTIVAIMVAAAIGWWWLA